MDLTYDKFPFEVAKILKDIAESHFIAFDLEFSGIAERSQQPGKPSLQELYAETKIAATRYQVLQVGLAIVKEDIENGQYIVKPYNFNINPLPTLHERDFVRHWTMSSGAVQFLVKNRFDFDSPLRTGIPYLSRAEEVEARLSLSGENDRKRPNMILKAEDDKLIKHIKTSIAAWQEQPEDERESYLNIPNEDKGKGVPGALNRYQMRLTHQVVQNDFPELQTFSMRGFVQITSPTEEERKRRAELRQKHIDREISRAIGFRWILEAIAGQKISNMPDECFLAAVSDFPASRDNMTAFQAFVFDLNQKLARRRRVLIGHNCFTDLVYLYYFFVGTLPDSIEEFRECVHDLFPAVVDTKHIASFGSGRGEDTSLAAVEEYLREETRPAIVVPPEFDRYAFDEKPHEAGYDAMLTANIAIKFSSKMERDEEHSWRESSRSTVARASTGAKMFGTNEEGYVTASEDLDRQLSGISVSKTNATEQITLDATKPTNISVEDQPTHAGPSEDPSPASTADHSNVVAVKEKKPKPNKWNPTAEVGKVKGTFATPNFFDTLGDEIGSNSGRSEEDDLISFSDTESTARGAQGSVETRFGVKDMVKQGILMPRWDGESRFWQVFGNRLQVNQSKEEVCEL